VAPVEEGRPPAVPIVGQRQVVAVAVHAEDDQAKARPGVEPGVENGKLGRLSLHAHGGEGGEQESATRGGVHRRGGASGRDSRHRCATFQATVIVIWLHPWVKSMSKVPSTWAAFSASTLIRMV